MPFYTTPKTIIDFSSLLTGGQLGEPLGKVDQKFVENMLSGIHQSASINLTEISKSLEEKIALHATHKRLSRKLNNPNLADTLSKRLLKLSSQALSHDTQLIVHTYEIHKKYANKMEYFPTPVNGTKEGFRVCEVLRSNASEKDNLKKCTPVYSRVWSNQTPGYINDGQEIKNTLEEVAKTLDNKGLFYFDDKTISSKILPQILEDSEFEFISLILGQGVKLSYKNQSRSPEDLVESVETKYGKTVFKLVPEGLMFKTQTDLDLFVHVGSLPVKIDGSKRPLSLIALKSKNALIGEYVSPIITSRTRLRSRKDLMGLAESIFSIQDTLAAHREIRQKFRPENFRVLTHDRLKLLMTLLQAVIYYENASDKNALIEDKQFLSKPRQGELDRTYLLPNS